MKKNTLYNVIFPILVILIIATGVVSNYEKNCYYSEDCFDQAFYECSKAKVTGYQNDNTFEYRVLKQKENSCIVNIKLIKVNPEVDQTTKERFQDKEMTCTLPQAGGFTTDKLNYCEGPLKEAIYETTIQKMYNLLAQSLGEIISEMKV